LVRTRREFVQIGLAAAAFASVSPAAGFAAEMDLTSKDLYKFVFDLRFPASVAAAREAARAGVPTHGIHGGVTELWYHDLYFAWKKGPAAIAGMTRKDSLFCLELLARDAGLRLRSSRELEGLVSWAIGPKDWTPRGYKLATRREPDFNARLRFHGSAV